jgi:hypothetical protein
VMIMGRGRKVYGELLDMLQILVKLELCSEVRHNTIEYELWISDYDVMYGLGYDKDI